MVRKIRLINQMRQALAILLKDGNGKMRQWFIPTRESRDIAPFEMSQDILDKAARGYLKITPIEQE